jgi:hypothetical protein
MNILKKITQPKTSSSKLKRFGKVGDGGYILDEDTAKNITRCYSYGIGGEISFEEELRKYNENLLIYLFDHTINLPDNNIHVLPKRMIWKKEGLGGFKTNELDNFLNHTLINGDKNLLEKTCLKIDAEGAEYDFFDSVTAEDFSSLRSIIIEFHSVSYRTEKFIETIEKINKNFDIIHIHGNNSNNNFLHHGFYFPDVPEITFLNKKFNQNSKDLSIRYPIDDLDFPNGSRCPDLVIDFLENK